MGRILHSSGNALKFSAAGTPVRVALAVSPHGAILTIGDRGRDFPGGQAAKIGAFMQFGRSSHEQQGLGFGLAIAKGLTELHGGSLSIQGSPGEGTTVMATLPRPL